MRTLTALLLCSALALGVANSAAVASDDPAPAAAQPATSAKPVDPPATDDAAAQKKALEDAIKKAKATAQNDQPPTPPPSPNAVPVTDGPVIEGTKKDIFDGIISEDLKLGAGYEVKTGDTVVAHYHGTLKDGGKVFDSSFDRGVPASFPLANVIPGWQKGVPGMKVGGVRRLTIPAKHAYGEAGRPGIPPNSDLVFIIQLVDALQTTDIKVGDGEEVGPQAVTIVAFTLKGEDGKEVASATKDKPYIWIPGELGGASQGMIGMKVGGKRTVHIPKDLNPLNPRFPTSLPQNVALTAEFEVLNVRNLAPAGGAPNPHK